MEQAEKLCDELCIIARGRKLVEGALSDIKRTRSGHHLIIGFDGSAGAAAQVFADRGLVNKVDDYGQYAELELAAGADPQQILQRLVASGARLSRFELQEPSLNKIFIDPAGPASSASSSWTAPPVRSGPASRSCSIRAGCSTRCAFRRRPASSILSRRLWGRSASTASCC